MNILQWMKEHHVFFDGGMGSLLQAQGLQAGELPETWNLLQPQVLVGIHKDYLRAGANIITTNTFGANRLKYPEGGAWSLEELVTASVENARTARREFWEEKAAEDTDPTDVEERFPAFIALDLGPTGKLLKPLGDLEFERAVGLYKEVIRIGVNAGADLILIETMSDSMEVKAAVLAAKESCDLPVFATMAFDSKGKLLTGGNVETIVALLEGLRVDALGLNCGLGPVQMRPIAETLLAVSSTPVIVNPNAGLPRSEGGQTVYDIDSDQFAEEMQKIAELGVFMMGGCCGTTPEHIEKTVRLCWDVPVRQPEKKNRTVIASYSQAVVMGRNPVIIGERINPTGKSKFKQALRDHNLEYILQEGVTQQDNGAHVLDVNVGLPEIDEPSMMEEVVKELQAVIDLPLQIDTSSPEAMERALRCYNGKALVNSVNGKQEVMEAVFPLVAKYGGVVVGLCLDEGGIPETAEGRIQVARKIYDTAARYGIDPSDIIIDGLCMTVSSDSKGALTTLETLRRVRDELQGKTILGVSNISFGLPQREIINAAFFTMALHDGLSAAIINPNNEAMMRAYYSFRALADLDPQCGDYIGIYGGQQAAGLGTTIGRKGGGSGAGSSSASGGGLGNGSQGGSGSTGSGGLSLSDGIIKGLKEAAAAAVREQLKSRDALDIINQEMIPALDVVGKGFEKGTVFLPQLLMSAEAAKGAFEVIKEHMSSSGQVQEPKGKVILATVKGDIHDIGKNIVKVLLENYSYDVIDLGKDVPPETVVETAVREHVPVVGLSALMTTTVPSMEETIRQLREHAPWVKVMVGGAVLTQEYADTIGADRYCRDAMASVNFAEEIIVEKRD
ncbi:MAG: homocysteine S-methyltransferase family protein [Lachnospiraceae bacterium]|nr:homocysteine S-methyltransferase family protein [Lachnospiraceae bacterium]